MGPFCRTLLKNDDVTPVRGTAPGNGDIICLKIGHFQKGGRHERLCGDKSYYSTMMACSTDISEYPGGGSAPLSSLMPENQLEGMKYMASYLAAQAETPNVEPPQNSPFIPTRDLSLAGLRIHDGHGRGVQQLETRPVFIKSDGGAVTKIPAGLWAVEVDALAGSNLIDTDHPTLNGDVTLSQWNGWIFLYDTQHVTISAGTRDSVMRRFQFEPGSLYRVTAQATGADTCVPSSPNRTCSAANDTLYAKVKAVACDDVNDIPNGLDPDNFCAQGLPFSNADFECDFAKGKCRECWLGTRRQQDCPEGGFCFEGMCDDADTCWSGTMTDKYEGAGNTESSPTISSWSPPIVRTLHKQDPGGIDRQDVDSFFVVASTTSGLGLTYQLHLDVRDLCSWGLVLPLSPGEEEIEGVQVRVQVPNVSSPIVVQSLMYENLTVSDDEGWVGIDRDAGLDVLIPTSAAARLNNGRSLRVQVRNQSPDFRSMPYSLDVDLSESVFHVPDLQVLARPEQEAIAPTEIVGVDVSIGDLVSIAPTNEAIEDGYKLFFKPAAGYEDAAARALLIKLVNTEGQAPTNDNGLEIAPTVPQDGGFAIPLGALNPKLGPYEARIETKSERVAGSVYLCSANTQNCATFNPLTSTCGSACTGDGVRCCADEDRNYYCSNLKGSDVMNCGACGNACDWDEKCLKGVCVKGKATSCWNTTCPENTECVSKDFLFLRNPQCRATLVDRTWCGWFGTNCSDTQDCVLGLCLPKMNVACGLKCLGEGQTCCWVNGVEQCVDVASSWGRCGSCGNACELDELCSGGKCEPWYTVAKVCPGEGGVNCSRTGISCKNILNDPKNCGGCGFLCPDTGWCENGQCVINAIEAENVH